MFAPVYFDHNATTPIDPRVRAAMRPYFDSRWGNASSRHEYGRAARKAVDEARQQVAAAVGAHPSEVIFTSGGSEANNLFVRGAAACLPAGLIAISAIEHPCVREPAKLLARRGWRLREIAVDGAGRIDAQDYAFVMEMRPALVSVMQANNETGVLQEVAALAAQARSARAWFHTDAVQALGKVPVDFRALGVHAMTVSAHKIGGPKGAAALIVDKRVDIEPLIAGGGHERGLRSGTENVAAIVGFGVACDLAQERLQEHTARVSALREELERGLLERGATLFGRNAPRLPNTVYFAWPELDGETLVGKLDRAGFAVAAGAACSSADPEPSRVLLAMGVAPALARGAVRVSLGTMTARHEVADFLRALDGTIEQLKGLAAFAH